MTAKELSRALNGLQSMGGSRSRLSIKEKESSKEFIGISYNVLPWMGLNGEKIVLGEKKTLPLSLMQVREGGREWRGEREEEIKLYL
jgi:hypothetical protein